MRGELQRRCIQALISRKCSPNIKSLGKLRQELSGRSLVGAHGHGGCLHGPITCAHDHR
ncbi:hypothetical protein GCM10019016_126990 [Streptomyces prasinosporus]|uniref:Uncharacterized protein n=1 Tax=Streptomyces prasinosporus TaxID=68256 RepID=A0ABP6UH98_9ACTN